jgi:hypothetical protein
MLVENLNYLSSQLQKSEVFEHIKANGVQYDDSLRKEERRRERHRRTHKKAESQ